MIYKCGNKLFDILAEHTIGDTTYPRGWFSDPVNRVAMGITEEPNLVTVPHVPTAKELADGLEYAVLNYLNAKAAEKDWDSIYTAALRAGYLGPWQKEGLIYAKWMDDSWQYCYKVQAACLAGTRTVPTAAQLIAELPVLVI